jgi:hypothetical protein
LTNAFSLRFRKRRRGCATKRKTSHLARHESITTEQLSSLKTQKWCKRIRVPFASTNIRSRS